VSVINLQLQKHPGKVISIKRQQTPIKWWWR